MMVKAEDDSNDDYNREKHESVFVCLFAPSYRVFCSCWRQSVQRVLMMTVMLLDGHSADDGDSTVKRLRYETI